MQAHHTKQRRRKTQMTDEPLEEGAQRVALWDETDSGILHSVHAYLMWHSGAVLSSNMPSREDRSIYLDMAADGAELEAIGRGFDMNDRRRVRSMLSLDTQTRHSPGEQPICYLDVEMIEQGFILPLNPPNGFSLEPIKLGYPRFGSFTDFKAAYRDLSYYVKHYPEEVNYQFQRLQRDYLGIANYRFQTEVESFHFIPPEFHIIGVPCDRQRALSQLNLAYDVGQLISLRGQIIEISEVKTTFTSIAWKCKDTNCREVHFVEQDQYLGTVAKPEPSCGKYAEMQHGQSNECNSKHFIRLPPPMSNAVSIQRVTLQEEELTNGEARTITVEIRGSLTETMIAGQGVEVVGILQTEPVHKGSLLENKFILAKSITEKTDIISSVLVSEEDINEVHDFVSTHSYRERMDLITTSWAGRIFAEDHIKEAMILQSCGGIYNEYSETRGTIHILLVGDPGTAKTKLLELASKLHPGSRFAQADATSQAGLVAGCNQVEDMYTGKKKWALVPGVLALTHQDAICSIDEFNLYKGDYGDFQNAMETGEVFVNKIVKGRVITSAPVLAGANPNNGNKKKWVRGEQTPYSDQIGLEFPMLQRFSMIFVLEDTPDSEKDEKVAQAMLRGVSKSRTKIAEEALSMSFIQKYLAIARSQNPLLTDKAANYIAKEHARKRQEGKEDSDDLRSHRQVNALWRLSSAIAKFELAADVDLEHIAIAEKILAETLEEKDPGLLTTGATKADREMASETREGIITFFANHDSDEGKSLSQLHEEVCNDISSWRKPTLTEFTLIINDLAESDSNGFTKAGDLYYKY